MELFELIRNLMVTLAMIAVIIFGVKYFSKEQLAVIMQFLSSLIKDVEQRRGSGNGPEKFNEVVAIAEKTLSVAEKAVVKKSIWKNIPNLVEHVFRLSDLFHVVKKAVK